MSNVLGDDKRHQIVALGRLGWSLRRIEQATGVRRETISGYLKAVAIVVRGPGRRSESKTKPAISPPEPSTDPGPSKPAISEAVSPASSPPNPATRAEVSTDSGVLPGPGRAPSPLANLFVYAVRSVSADADGLARARSATEAFLFRRLESLPETRKRFALNTPLPIAFDGAGTLEVDLLCADARVAVELDGAQHLSDPVAYRSDRRKDQLLQENGYFVLRFLAEDVGKELDAVLDAVQRALSRRQA